MFNTIFSHAFNKMKSRMVNGIGYGTLFRKVSTQETGMDNKAILTLFATFKQSRRKSYIHRNTIRNWGLLSPDVLPVLFVKLKAPSDIVDNAHKRKWHIFPVPRRSESGIPVLSDYSLFDTFYAYANNDILFDRNLTDTLYELIRLKKNLTNLLVVGRRRNWKINSQQSVSKLDEIGHYAKSAKLFNIDAQDDFISIRNGYTWSTIPDFVVGRKSYDNWLAATAVAKEIPLVDATATITALHQTDAKGDHEGLKAQTGTFFNFLYRAMAAFTYMY